MSTLSALLVTGGTLAITGTYLLVTFAPHTSTHITAHLVQYYAVSWHFLLYLVSSECKTLSPDAPINVSPGVQCCLGATVFSTPGHLTSVCGPRQTCLCKQSSWCSAVNYLLPTFNPPVEKSNWRMTLTG